MRFKSVNFSFAHKRNLDLILAAGTCLALMGPTAYATVTVTATDPYLINSSNTVYYSADSAFTGIMDEEADYKNFDLTVGQSDDSSGDNMLTFNVTSSETFSDSDTAKKLVITVFATAQNGGDLVPVPIATVDGTACSSTRCQDDITSGSTTYYLSAHSTTSSTAVTSVEVGIYPRDICSIVYAQSSSKPAVGCTDDLIDAPSSSSATTLTLTFAVGLADDDSSSLDPDSVTEKSDEIGISLHAAEPVFSCPSMSGIYTPGDGQIELSTAFEDEGTSANAPVDTLIVVAADGAAPVTSDSTFATANLVFGRFDLDSGTESLDGFTNTTDGSDHKYSVRFSVRDVSGRVAAFSSDASCQLEEVQTSDIEGLLNKSQCFIATAAFRSDRHPAVMLLRTFRDEILLTTDLGSELVRFYYRWSPGAAHWLIRNPQWRLPVLVSLVPPIAFAWLVLHPIYLLGLVSLGMGFWLVRRRVFEMKKTQAASTALSLLLICLLATGVLAGCSSAPRKEGVAKSGVASDPNAPYLAKIRTEIEKEEGDAPTEGSFLRQEQDKLKEGTEISDQEYMAALKKKISEEDAADTSPAGGGAFLDVEREKILRAEAEEEPTGSTGSAIEDVRRGIELRQALKAGDIHHGMGFKFGASIERAVSLGGELGTGVRFTTLYAAQVAPDLTLSYEWQPLHSENFGSLGFGGMLGASLYRGKGAYSVDLPGFGSTSDTEFRFVFVPVMALVNYRFNLFRVVRPFVQAAGGFNLFLETRGDGGTSHRGYSKSAAFTGGVAINLDYLSPNKGWSVYEERGVHHTFLTLDYTRQVHLGGDLSVEASGINAGLNYEF